MTLQTMLDAAAAGRSVEIETGWTQGRAVYGGLQGALLLAAIKARLAGDGEDRQPLRSLTVSFVAPPAGDEPLQVEARVLRAGTNVTQCQATLLQGETILATGLASFGRHRESAVTVAPAHPMPELVDPETIEPFPYLEGLTPEFFRFVDLRLVSGGLPYTGSETAGMTGWMAFREPPAAFGEEHLVALADAWPPAVIQMLTDFAPASSLTWTLELVTELDAESAPDGGRFAYEVETDAAGDGYAHTHAMLWRPDGTLVAISRQTITVFG